MVASSSVGKMTATVSIDEKLNTEVEIPRIDPKDKPKLWISKIEIHHNTMMEKIRLLVQEKLFELVASDNNFFAGIEDFAIEIDDDDDSLKEEGEQNPESEEEILLIKKARFMKSLLREIMEMPKDDIFSFLTSSSLPSGLNVTSKKSKRNESNQEQNDGKEQVSLMAAENSPVENSVTEDNENKNTILKEEDYYGYNWIQNCTDAWKDLPAVVRMNAMELGYTESLWDEDSQDLPAYHTFWNNLTPNQRTAAIFLANYDEKTWNDEVRIHLMAGKNPSLASIVSEESSDEEPIVHEVPVSDTPTATQIRDIDLSKDSTHKSVTEMFEDSDDDGDDDDDDDDDDMFNEFVSNFIAEANEEDDEEECDARNTNYDRDAIARIPEDDVRRNDVDEEAMMDEFLSNFAESTKKGTTDSIKDSVPESDTPIAKVGMLSKSDDEEKATMDEFLSNFGVSAEENASAQNDEKQSRNAAMVPNARVSASPKEVEDEDIMMDEFLSNFVEPKNKDNDIDIDSGNKENESLIPGTVTAVPKGNDDDEDTMMDEFHSNFVDSTKEEVQNDDETDSDNKIIESMVPATASVVPKESDDEDAMMDEFLSNFVESTKEELQHEDKTVSSSEVSVNKNFESFKDNVEVEDEEEPSIFTPKMSSMERGFEGERSPLLPSSATATYGVQEEIPSETEKPDPQESSSWYSSLLYWVPVVVIPPVLYMVVNSQRQSIG